MLDFEIKRSERRCSKTGRELVAGDEFYSVLLPGDGGQVSREDIYFEAWEGPPEDCLGWWKTQVPSLASLRMKWAPNDVMLHYFDSLTDAPDRQDLRFVLSLLLMRRKILAQQEPNQLATAPTGVEMLPVDQEMAGSQNQVEPMEELQFYCAKNQKEYSVAVVEISPARIGQIQDELAELLYSPSG